MRIFYMRFDFRRRNVDVRIFYMRFEVRRCQYMWRFHRRLHHRLRCGKFSVGLCMMRIYWRSTTAVPHVEEPSPYG